MHMPKTIDTVINYVSGAVSRIFGLDDDNYPATGVQPFSGKIDHARDKKHKADW
jgi:hypothetical protein